MTAVLGIETTAGACSAALWRDGGVAAHRRDEMDRGHAEAIMPMIVGLMGEARTAFSALGAVGVTTGPGAFTGIRIGLAAARGIALAASIPAIGVTAFEALAAALDATALGGRRALIVIDTKRGDYYAQAWHNPCRPAGDAGVFDAARLGEAFADVPLYVTGDGAAGLQEAWRASKIDAIYDSAGAPDARSVAALAAGRLAAGSTGGPPPEPLYLRPPEAKLPKRRPGRGP